MLRALAIVPLPVTILIISILCPTELSLFIGGLRLPPNRVALLILLPIAIYRLLTARHIRAQSFDYIFLLFGFATLYVYTMHSGKDGLVYGGSVALECLGGYFIARAYIRTPEMLRQTLRVMLLTITIAALIALPEFLFGQNFTHDILRSLTGYHHPTAVQTRLGMTRAYGTFDHPIHYGTFCASMLALLVYAERKKAIRRKRAALVVGATFLGLSSAPLLSLALQGALIVWDRTTRAIAARLSLTVAALVGLYIGIDLLSSRSPLAILATRLTLDTWTGYYRLFIWEHGLKNVWEHPWLGLGLAEWTRPWWMVADTIDAYWLVLAMRQGIPSFLLLAIGIALLVRATVVNRRFLQDGDARNMLRGWTMSLVALCLIGSTVHYWNVLHTYMFFLIGIGGVFADPIRRKAGASLPRQSRQRNRIHDLNTTMPGGPLASPVSQPAAPPMRAPRPQPNTRPQHQQPSSLLPPPLPSGFGK
ncbi:MAG: O-antigen ligase family protein [Pseudomonadota bacterium]